MLQMLQMTDGLVRNSHWRLTTTLLTELDKDNNLRRVIFKTLFRTDSFHFFLALSKSEVNLNGTTRLTQGPQIAISQDFMIWRVPVE